MKKILLFIALGLILVNYGCGKKVGGVYCYNIGKINNYDIWIVDGNQVRLKIFSS
jgi:hypothetical protein